MTEHEPGNGGVRVTNAEIYRLLLEANGRVTSVQQTIHEVVMPRLATHGTQIDALLLVKADRAAVDAYAAQLDRVKLQVYAIGAGLLGALGIGKGTGIL